MSYVEDSLINDESILYRTGLHSVVLFFPAIFGGVFICFGALSFIGGAQGSGLFLVALGAAIIGIAVVARISTEMAVTNKRVIIKSGIIRRRTIEMFLSKIESIDVDQGIFARMLGYGTITVRGTGGTREPFNKVKSPLEFRRQVQQFTVI